MNKETYNPKKIQEKWQKIWAEKQLYKVDLDHAKKPFYNLMMFPYPSAEGLHVGNMYAFTGADIYARFNRMQGKDVFEPIGLDGFGIHSENYALKVGRTPQEHAKISQENFYRQLHTIGNSFDWSRKLETYDPGYYKWTQWLFIQLFKAGLAYRKKSPVNYCPSCKTVLADEQVISDKCERCGTVVEKRNIEQWFFQITKYAERLLQNIEKLDWSEKVKIAQRNWIGKKEGARIGFRVEGIGDSVEVFTTRPDTLYGVTFLVVAPEHPLVKQIIEKRITVPEKIMLDVEDYARTAVSKLEQERIAEGKEKTGVFSGMYAEHPLTKEKLPIWIADYVLMNYGTGAIMAVPAHDERDFEFAKKYHLPIQEVVKLKEKTIVVSSFTEEGVMINSQDLNGMTTEEAKEKVIAELEKKGIGKREVTYHLRDWIISRQRYWGPPIPMVYCSACAEKGISWFNIQHDEQSGMGMSNDKFQISNKNNKEKIGNSTHMSGWFPVPEDQLPVLLPPLDDWKPTGDGKGPLARLTDWVNVPCPYCGSPAKRETDVSDSFLDSSWYFLRYLATDRDDIPFPMRNQKAQRTQKVGDSDTQIIRQSHASGSLSFPSSPEIEDRLRFLPVNMYIGGAEHSVLHLLYARFITMVLQDLGMIDFDEPFSRFYAHGLVIKDGAKMSKSKGNVIVPDQYINKYGSDTLRTYLMFLGPFSQGGDFRDSGIEGMHRFLKRIYILFKEFQISNFKFPISNENKKRISTMHRTIKEVTEDMEELRYNTAIAHLMEYYNYLSEQKAVSRQEAEIYIKLLAPFAPFMTEELWQEMQIQNSKFKIQNFSSIHFEPWPRFDPSYLIEDEVVIAVQVNGKLRDTIEITNYESQSTNRNTIERMAKEREKVKKYLEGNEIKKVIYVPGRIINFVVY